MTEQQKDDEIRSLEAQIKQAKYGDLFKPSQFSNPEEAQKFVEEYRKTLPITDAEKLEEMGKKIAEAEKSLKAIEEERAAALVKHLALMRLAESFNHIVPTYVSACRDETGKSLYPDIDKAVQNKGHDIGAMLEPPMSEEVQNLCYPFMQEWRRATLGSVPFYELEKIKTPYKKLPFKTRAEYRIKKALKMKVDPEVHKMAEAHTVLRDDIRSGEGTIWDRSIRGGSKPITDVEKYLHDLLSQPYQEMMKQVDHDRRETRDPYEALVKKAEQLKQECNALKQEKTRMLTINDVCEEITKAMEERKDHHFKLKPLSHDARVVLARRGLLTNEEVKKPSVSGVVQANEIASQKMLDQRKMRM